MARILVSLLALALLASAGCTPTGAFSDARATVTLRPLASATASPHIPPLAVSSATPGPTATPFTYVVQSGETLIYIAFIHGITLEALVSANPGLDPRFLPVGHELIIPLPGGEQAQEALPQVTPVPVSLAPVSCYRTPSNGLWCLTAAYGSLGQTVEGIAAVVLLYDALGGELARGTAYGPLNLLGPEQIMPLAAFFAPPAPEYSQAVATLLTAFGYGGEDERYLEVEVRMNVVEALPDSTRWRLNGSVSLAAGETGSADRITLLVVALGAGGDVVGFNIWESDGAVAAGEQIPVEMDLFSLGPPIADIEIMAEAQAPQ